MLDFLSQFGYPILFILNILETAIVFGFVLPADSLLVMSGFLAHLEIFNLKYSIAVSFFGAIIGDNIAYYTGRKYGRKVLKKHKTFMGIKQKHFDYTKDFFHKHGNKSVLVGRFFAYIRSFIPLLAGINKMPYRFFLLYEIVGAFIWAVSFNIIGFYFGQNWDLIHSKIKIVGESTVGAIALIALVTYFYRKRRQRLQS